MEIGKQIKLYRQEAGMSQETLADIIYVSRQTISNWETGKSYPDVNSLLLLSEAFKVPVDHLIKGDIHRMKETICKEEIRDFKRDAWVYTLLLVITLASAQPLSLWLGLWALLPWGFIVGVTLLWAVRIEKTKKRHDIQTYKEIVAFCEGKRLDEIQKQREIGARPYQKILLAVMSALAGAGAFFLFDFVGKWLHRLF